jgi:16S rRNA (guanine966-N2)-methyltransferase
VRIIGGTHKGRIIKAPKGLELRPTTDFAKEGLFNILAGMIDLTESQVLDLFSGTGSISLEMASRGAKSVTSVDKNPACARFLSTQAREFGFQVSTVKEDIFRFLENCRGRFQLIFADPPYDLKDIPRIHELVFQKKLLDAGGILIIEHGASTDLSQLQGFIRQRKYGNVNFSFFAAQ